MQISWVIGIPTNQHQVVKDHFEFSSQCYDNDSRMLISSMNWLTSYVKSFILLLLDIYSASANLMQKGTI